MATAPMTISTFLKVAPLLPPETSILLKGPHGIGKSQLGRQLAASIRRALKLKDTEFPVIDRRLSQQTEGDIIGLPSTDGNVTRFNPPDWYKTACTQPCFLFLDEINRATPEVMQAAFQIVLDRELNGWKLHPLTRVMSAVNASASYTVNEIDPALLDRFWCIELNATHDDWLNWAREATLAGDDFHKGMDRNVLPVIADFIAHENKWLDPAKNADPSAVEPSRRSWDRLSMALSVAKLEESPTDAAFYAISCGYVGLEAAIAFCDFAKTQDNRVTGKDVLDNYEKVRSKIERLGPEKQNIVIDKLSEYVLSNVKTINEKQGNNLAAFTKTLTGELRLSLWSKLTANGTDRIELARSIHKYMAAEILSVFGVPMGEAGIGVTPKIPGMFKDKDKKDKSEK